MVPVGMWGGALENSLGSTSCSSLESVPQQNAERSYSGEDILLAIERETGLI